MLTANNQIIQTKVENHLKHCLIKQKFQDYVIQMKM
jgi:hypothetical protein